MSRRRLSSIAVLVASIAMPSVARAVTVTPYTTASSTRMIATGPDGRLWLTESDRIGAITTGGTLTEYTTGVGGSPKGIAAGPDGKVWFTEPLSDKVAQITTAGAVTEYASGITAGAHPDHIAAGPDGNLWFTEPGIDKIAKVTTGGAVTEYGGFTAGGQPTGITAGPDGNLWVTEPGASKVASVTPAGGVTEYATGITAGSQPLGIVAGADGAMWFGESQSLSGNVRVGRITTGGSVTQYLGAFNGLPPAELAVAGSELVYGALGSSQGEVGRVTDSGLVGRTTFPFGGANPTVQRGGIAVGPDGNVWLTGVSTSAPAPAVAKLVAGTTPSVSYPDPAVSNITETQASLHATVTGSAWSGEFQYGTTTSYGSSTSTGYPYTSSPATKTLSGLTPGTTYHYRFRITNIDGTVAGADQSFTTASGPTAPAVDTLAATTVGTTTATVKGTVNPNNGATTYHVDYGPTASYGSSTTDVSAGSDGIAHTFFVDLTGLPSGGALHYRFVASNSAGTTPGPDRTLTTYTAVPATGPGSLAAFGAGGTTALDFGSSGFVEFDAVAAQDDGKLVVAGGADTGGTRDVAIARLNADGTNDGTFNGGTPLLVPIAGGSATATGVAIQPDGHIVVVANAGSTGQVLRVTSAGALDTSFDGDGIEQFTFSPGNPQTIRGVAVQPADGKIVVAGSATQAGLSKFAIARLNADGTPDGSFDGGVVLTPFSQGPAFARAVAIQDDGAIVAAGGTTGGFAAARYDTGGVLDPSFGSGGLAFVATPGGAPEADGLALDPFDGTLLLAGPAGTSSVIARLTSAGAPDPSFGTAGLATLAIPGASPTAAEAVLVSGAGGPLVAGAAGLNGEMHGFLARLTPSGAPDTTYGQGGLLTFDAFGAFHALAELAPPPFTPRDSAAGSDPATAAAGAKTTATDPSGPTPTQSSGSATKVNDCEPAFRFDPDPLTFPPLTVGQTSAPRTVTVTNVGNCFVVIRAAQAGAVSGSGVYNVVKAQCVVVRLEPGQSCTIDVTYTARAAGVQDGYLTLAFASHSWQRFANGHLTGTGIDSSGPPPPAGPPPDISACAGRTISIRPPAGTIDPGDGLVVAIASWGTSASGQEFVNHWQFTASGGRAPYSYTIAAAPPLFDPLPTTGLGIGADGVLSWRMGLVSHLDIVVTATDADGCVAHLRFSASPRPYIPSGTKTTRVPADGRTTVSGACPPGAAPCAFSATVSVSGGKARAAAAASIGTVKGTIAAGRQGRLKLVLNRRGIATLRHSRVLKVTVHGTVKQGKVTSPLTGTLKLSRR